MEGFPDEVLRIFTSYCSFREKSLLRQISQKFRADIPNGIDEWINTSKDCKHLEMSAVMYVCKKAQEILFEEPNLVYLEAPITVCGDIHGQLYDLLKLFDVGGQLPATKYLFMGDYVDRGYWSVETFTLLLTLKIKFPDKIYLLRGNHESRQISQIYGFYDECMIKYGDPQIWLEFMKVFDLLPISALIDNRIFCVHGGISPDLKSLDDVKVIERHREIPHEGIFADLMWSDPDEIPDWNPAVRGAGWVFGRNPLSEFNQKNNLDLVARSHQLVNEGYKYMFDEGLVTVWSAPNYCYRCGNKASVMVVDTDGKRTFRTFDEVPDQQRKFPQRSQIGYFL